jgi:hypothetical protein
MFITVFTKAYCHALCRASSINFTPLCPITKLKIIRLITITSFIFQIIFYMMCLTFQYFPQHPFSNALTHALLLGWGTIGTIAVLFILICTFLKRTLKGEHFGLIHRKNFPISYMFRRFRGVCCPRIQSDYCSKHI